MNARRFANTAPRPKAELRLPRRGTFDEFGSGFCVVAYGVEGRKEGAQAAQTAGNSVVLGSSFWSWSCSRSPLGTKTTIIDIDGINAVETVVWHARTDAAGVLDFDGGGYAFGTEPWRDFTWRLGAAAGASVLHLRSSARARDPFSEVVEDAGKQLIAWLARRMDPSRIVFVGDSPAAALSSRPCTKCATKATQCCVGNAAISPWTHSTDWLLAAYQRQGRSDDGRETFADVRGDDLGGADPRHPYASRLDGDLSGLLLCSSKSVVTRSARRRRAHGREAARCRRRRKTRGMAAMPHVWHHYARILPEGCYDASTTISARSCRRS